jgi:hypothetical protein
MPAAARKPVANKPKSKGLPPRLRNPAENLTHRWQPGQSGNPSGRPKALVTLRDMARVHTPELMAELINLAMYAESENVRLGAIREVLDRGWGRSITPIQVSPGTPGTAVVAAVVGELPEIEGDLVVGEDGVYRVEAVDEPGEPSDPA